jgi:AcrR family transcriptional regulator
MLSNKRSATLLRKKRKEDTVSEGHGEDTAGRIVYTATRLFAQKGYDGTSVKEICEAAGVNIAAIHYHFESKKDLYRHIIEQFATERVESLKNVLQPAQSVDDLKVRLEIFLRQVVEALIKQPDVALLIQRGIEMFDPTSEDVFRNTMLKLFKNLVEFLEKAKKQGLLAADVDPYFAAGFLRSQFLHQTRIDRVIKKYFGYSLSDEKYREQWVQQTIRLFLGGIVGK